MSIASQLQHFLNQQQVAYQVVCHPYSNNPLHTARVACVPARQMIKALMLEDASGYVMAVMPSLNRLVLPWINHRMNRRLSLVKETALKQLLPDCEVGAIPALGIAYGFETIWDESLAAIYELYFEGGNHRELVHLQRDDFQRLLHDQPRATISCYQDQPAAINDSSVAQTAPRTAPSRSYL